MKNFKKIYNNVLSALKRRLTQTLAVSLRNKNWNYNFDWFVSSEYIYFITDDINGTYPEVFYFIIAKTDNDVIKYFEKLNNDNLKIHFNSEIGKLHRKNRIHDDSYYVIGKILIKKLKHKTGKCMYDICYGLFDNNIRTSGN